jgi:hypothetical protein
LGGGQAIKKLRRSTKAGPTGVHRDLPKQGNKLTWFDRFRIQKTDPSSYVVFACSGARGRIERNVWWRTGERDWFGMQGNGGGGGTPSCFDTVWASATCAGGPRDGCRGTAQKTSDATASHYKHMSCWRRACVRGRRGMAWAERSSLLPTKRQKQRHLFRRGS